LKDSYIINLNLLPILNISFNFTLLNNKTVQHNKLKFDILQKLSIPVKHSLTVSLRRLHSLTNTKSFNFDEFYIVYKKLYSSPNSISYEFLT
jgi:hypothetical protein